MPTGAPIQCGHCGTAVGPDAGSPADGLPCLACGQPTRVYLFPAVQRSFAGARPEALLGSEESACYFHPENRAATVCDHCGRFLCALCDLPVGGRHLCAPCLNSGAAAPLETQRTRYDSLALLLSTWTFFTTYFAIFASFAALWFVVRHWNDPPGLFPRGRWRFVVAALCALAQIALWGGIIGFAIWQGIVR